MRHRRRWCRRPLPSDERSDDARRPIEGAALRRARSGGPHYGEGGPEKPDLDDPEAAEKRAKKRAREAGDEAEDKRGGESGGTASAY